MKRILFLMLALTVILTGCSHRTYGGMESTSVKRDSLVVHFIDSVRWQTKTQIKDSVNVRDSIVIKVDAEGNEIGRSEWHERDHYREVKDSTAFYKQMCDSLMKMTAEKDTVTIHDIEYRDKPLTKWQSIKMDAGGFAIGISAAAIIGLLVWLVLKFRKKIPI
ncbi:MAG: hypothetical protein IJ640_06690 [Prevotella sp.]|nr:hypothetical protein [Prevotella sp.]